MIQTIGRFNCFTNTQQSTVFFILRGFFQSAVFPLTFAEEHVADSEGQLDKACDGQRYADMI